MLPTTKYQTKRKPRAFTSRGGLDEINPDDIVYGEYSNDKSKNYGEWIDLIYLDGDILRTFSQSVSPIHPVIEELKVILRDDDKFYLVIINEVPNGFAFKRNDIVNIKITSVIEGNSKHDPSCAWTIKFDDGNVRALEVEYQSYFAYGNTNRPQNMTNKYILDKVFSK